MLYSALAFLAGISTFQRFAELPAPKPEWLLVLVLPALWRWRITRLVLAALAGLLWAWWHAAQLLQLQLPDTLEGRDLQVQGVVVGLPQQYPDGTRNFRFMVERYRLDNSWHNERLPVRLSWYRHAQAVSPGQSWSLRVRLKRPRGFANPGGFDYARGLFAKGVRATGYVRRAQSNRLLDNGSAVGIDRLRLALTQRISAYADNTDRAALLNALAVGVQQDISRQQWQTLRRTGTGHLIAISGLHVGLVAGLVFLASRRAWSRWGAVQRITAPGMAAIVAMMAALGYALLAGFEVPAQRATVMVWVWMSARIAGGRPDPWRVWSLALWLLLILDPLSVLSSGFWLSFGAVAWILYLSSGRYGRVAKWRSVGGLQCGLVAGLTPILWLCFHQASVIAPLANLLAIPWIGLLVVPLLLVAVLCIPLLPALADTLLYVAGGLLDLLWGVLEWLAALPFSLLALPQLPAPLMVLFALGLLCCLAARAVPLRLPGLMLLVPALAFKAPRPLHGDLRLTLLDVGQGLATVVETRHHVLVYDAGPAFPSGFNTGDSVVAPFLEYRGYRRLDRLIISHADNDHRGGGAALFARLDVQRLHSGEPQRLDWAYATRCRAGQHWVWDDVQFEYLGPAQTQTGNNASCVLRIETADGQVVLLTGDIERRMERELLTTQRAVLPATVLVVPHHGSRTSSSTEFVAAVRPQYALFPTGYGNRFGFPRAEVLARYDEIGARLLDTADSGAVELRLAAGKPVAVRTHRARVRRYWH